MKYVLFAVSQASNGELINAYVASCDVDAHDGVGEVRFTSFEEQAMQFDNATEALEFWRRPSTVRPYRKSDGQTNRPLTAYTCSVEPTKEER
jgi:hypothetical protein